MRKREKRSVNLEKAAKTAVAINAAQIFFALGLTGYALFGSGFHLSGLAERWLVALMAIVVALFGGGVGLQVTVFLVVAILLLASLRGMVRKHFTPRLQKTNIDSIIGTTGVVTTPVNNIAALGRVTISGMEWSARSTTGAPLPEGAKVIVDRIEGVKVFVSLAEEPVTQ